MFSWCVHRNQTTPRKDAQGEYCRCLECGARIPWSWGDRAPARPSRPLLPSPWQVFWSSLRLEPRGKMHRF
jgi:hypothetical protein